MPTALAKKMDQLFLSRAELKRNKQVAKVKRLVKTANGVFLSQAENQFGALFVRRLVKSAKRAGRSPIGYAADVLLS